MYERMSNQDTSKAQNYIPQFFSNKSENASQTTENVHGAYGPDASTVNYAKL